MFLVRVRDTSKNAIKKNHTAHNNIIQLIKLMKTVGMVTDLQ